MGYMNTVAMIETGADRKILLRWHLQTNHVPAVHPEWIPCAEWVIDRALAGEDLDVPAPVPEGYPPNTARFVFDGLHLAPFAQEEFDADFNPEDAH